MLEDYIRSYSQAAKWQQHYLNRAEKAETQVAELGERLGDANTMLEKCNSQFIVEMESENAALREDAARVTNLHLAAVNLYLAGAAELEAENAALREAVGTMLSRLEQRGFNNEDVLFLDLNTIYYAARKK